MQNKPLVSVLMTVYNREKYIAEAIESVLASTYTNWELIIVDDQSKDNSLEIAKSYEAKDNRIKVYVNEENLGDYPNRNKAASFAKGKYLKYVDADDLIYEHTLKYMVEMMERYDISWASFSVKQNPFKPHPYVLDTKDQFKGQYIDGMGYFSRSPLSVMIKTDVFHHLKGFENRKMVGDFEMWHRLGAKYQLLVLPHSHGFVWYRSHEDQQSSEINKYEGEYRKISLNYLRNGHSQLDSYELQKIILKLNKSYLKRFIRLLLKFNFKQLRYI